MKNTKKDNAEELGDFTTSARVIPIAFLAILIGLVSTYIAWLVAAVDQVLHQPVLLRAL